MALVVHHRRWAGTQSGAFSRAGLVDGTDEPTAPDSSSSRTGTIPMTALTPFYPNATLYGNQPFYDQNVPGAQQHIRNAHFVGCRFRAKLGGSLINARIDGAAVPSPNSTTNYAMIDMTQIGGAATPDRFYGESIDVTPAPGMVGPCNTGIRGGGGVFKFIYGKHLTDGIMVYGGVIDIGQSLFERPYTTWPANDPTRTTPSASHADIFAQIEGGSLIAHGCKASAFPADPIGGQFPVDADGLFYDSTQDEWYGRYLPRTNGAGFSVLLSSGNDAKPLDVKFENGWVEGAAIPFYYTHASPNQLPTGVVSLAGTRMRLGALRIPNATSPRYHIIRTSIGPTIDLTGAIPCTDDRTKNPDGTSTWTPSGGNIIISNASA